MPTDLLFDYDSANLRPGATASLQKLGHLIQRNPQSVFRVEGHTDSFGSDQYNMDLSQRRAETVKTWLVGNMSIDLDRIKPGMSREEMDRVRQEIVRLVSQPKGM